MSSRFIPITYYICLVFIGSCDDKPLSVTRGSFESMGTMVIVQPASATHIVQEIFERVDSQMSEWKVNSPLSVVNAQAGKSPVVCPPALCSAIALALSISKQTEGAFDPTWAALWDLWDFKNPRLPKVSEISSRLPLVNWKNVVLDGSSVFLAKKGMALGLGGIAKGIALNQARDALLSHEINDFMIVVGGQVLVHGDRRRIGIRKPDGLQNEYIGIVEIENKCISTSGDYEKYFEDKGIRYHHILDPSTGYPARGLRSVTVIANDAAVADALSTGLFVMGLSDAMRLVEHAFDIEALFIDSHNVVFASSGFQFCLENK
jgi:thiamine biosynthesis lipoprotein